MDENSIDPAPIGPWLQRIIRDAVIEAHVELDRKKARSLRIAATPGDWQRAGKRVHLSQMQKGDRVRVALTPDEEGKIFAVTDVGPDSFSLEPTA